jgi:ABC-type multidrug transport system fused ATPase/permease subunit
MTQLSISHRLASLLIWPAGTTLVCVILGFELTRSDRPLVLVALIWIVALIRVQPVGAIVGTFALIALPRSLDLQILHAPGLPLTAQDAFPFVFLGAALELRRRESGARSLAPALGVVVWLSVGGLILGGIVGHTDGAPSYQLLRVLRVEVGLIVGLLAAAVAGHIGAWRRAVRSGLIVAGGLTVVEIILSVAYGLATGKSFWGAVGLAGAVDVYAGIRGGDVNVLRSNDLSTFLILPAFALAVARMGRRDIFLVSVALAASLMSLSRGFWAATFGVGAVAVAYRVREGREGQVGVFIKWIGVAVVVGLLATHFIGSVVSTRVNQTSGFSDDSSRYRLRETNMALHQLARDPLRLVVGTGAGVILPAPPKYRPVQDPRATASFLENSLLSRWTNLSILSVVSAVVLLLVAGRIGWRSRWIAPGPERDLRMMGLSLPVVLVGGVASGAAFSQGTLPFWILAGTLLMTPCDASSRGNPASEVGT